MACVYIYNYIYIIIIWRHTQIFINKDHLWSVGLPLRWRPEPPPWRPAGHAVGGAAAGASLLWRLAQVKGLEKVESWAKFLKCTPPLKTIFFGLLYLYFSKYAKAAKAKVGLGTWFLGIRSLFWWGNLELQVGRVWRHFTLKAWDFVYLQRLDCINVCGAVDMTAVVCWIFGAKSAGSKCHSCCSYLAPLD